MIKKPIVLELFCRYPRHVGGLTPPTIMRLGLWFVLILAFSAGMCCALAVRAFYFEAMPAVEQVAEQTTKILVAKRAIPKGVEITADFLLFQEVPLSEVPVGSMASFTQVYRRQPAYPIPAGCPICEDLLLPPTAAAEQAAFIPTGSQVVALDITHIRLGNRVLPPREPLSMVLPVDQRVDVRLVLPEAQGRLADKKNAILRAFAPQGARSSGEPILENVPIHRVQRLFSSHQIGLPVDSLELMLDRREAARLSAAARRGQLRIFVRSDESTPQQAAVESIFEIVTPPLFDPQPLQQPMFLDTPYAEHSQPILQEWETAIPAEHVQHVPETTDIFDLPLPEVPEVVSISMSEEEMLPSVDHFDEQQDGFAVADLPELPIEEIDVIRNDGFVAFSSSPFRGIPSDFGNISPEAFPAENQDATPTEFPFALGEPGHEALTRPALESLPHSERTMSEMVMGTPRGTNTVQFLSPRATPASEQPQESVGQASPVTLSQVIPSALTAPIEPQERVSHSNYTPFEHRTYVVPASDELQAPQRLIRSSDFGARVRWN